MPPTLETARLLLRTLRRDDADAVWELARDRAIADMTGTVPHPYERPMADVFIAARTAPGADEETAIWAVVQRVDDRLLGVISLAFDRALDGAELGYWTGVPFWGQGFTTEAARAVLGHGLAAGALATVWSSHVTRNVASHRVMEKAGMASTRETSGFPTEQPSAARRRTRPITSTSRRPTAPRSRLSAGSAIGCAPIRVSRRGRWS